MADVCPYLMASMVPYCPASARCVYCERDSLRDQLAQVTAERDEARDMEQLLKRSYESASALLITNEKTSALAVSIASAAADERDTARALADVRGREIERLTERIEQLVAERDAAYSRGHADGRIEPIAPAALTCAKCQCVTFGGIQCACPATERADKAERDRDDIEARIIALIDAAHVGPVQVPDDVSAETRRVVNAVRVNVRCRQRIEEERNALREELATASETARDYGAAHAFEAIASWLECGADSLRDTGNRTDTMRVEILDELTSAVRAGAWKEQGK